VRRSSGRDAKVLEADRGGPAVEVEQPGPRCWAYSEMTIRGPGRLTGTQGFRAPDLRCATTRVFRSAGCVEVTHTLRTLPTPQGEIGAAESRCWPPQSTDRRCAVMFIGVCPPWRQFARLTAPRRPARHPTQSLVIAQAICVGTLQVR